MAEPVTCENDSIHLQTASTEGDVSVGLTNGTSGDEGTESCDHIIEKNSPDDMEMKSTTQPALAISSSQSQQKQNDKDAQTPTPISEDAACKNKDQKPTPTSEDVVSKNKDERTEEYSEEADSNTITSSSDTSNIKIGKEEEIREQAQRILGKNYPQTIKSLTPSVLNDSCSSTTESENVDSSLDVSDKNLSQNVDSYSFRNRKLEKCSKQKDELPLGHEVTDAYEELVLGKDAFPQSVNVAARKLLSEHSESRVPEYFQKTLKKEKSVESNPKSPIPRSDFHMNVGHNQDYMKNAVKPTVTPCTPFVKEVTMKMKMISHIPSSVVTLNKDGTEQQINTGQDGGEQRVQNLTENQKLSASKNNRVVTGNKVKSPIGKTNFRPTARKSCPNGISKKLNAKARIRNAVKVKKSKNILSSILSARNTKYSSSDSDESESNSCDDALSDDLYIPPPHHRKSFQPHGRRRYYTARKSVPSLASKKPAGGVKNKTFKKGHLNAANTKKHLKAQSNKDSVVTNYVLVPIPAQNDHQKDSSEVSAEVTESRIVDLPGTFKMKVNGIIGKQKVTVNNLLNKTSRDIVDVDIRRGNRKRKAPRRFTSQSSDEEKQPGTQKKRFVNRRRDGVNTGEDQEVTRGLQIKTFKNKVINTMQDKAELGQEQENILTEGAASNFIITSRANQQLKYVKSKKANVFLSTGLMKGRTVHELISLVDRAKNPMKNGERPLSVLLPASSAVGNMHTQQYLLQESMSIVLPVTSTVTSSSLNSIADVADTMTVCNTDTQSSIVNVNENRTNVSQGADTSRIDQTKCHSDTKCGEQSSNKTSLAQGDQPPESDIQEIVELQQSKINSTDKDGLPKTGFLKQRKQSDNIFSLLNAIKQGVLTTTNSECAARVAKTSLGSNSDCVKLKVNGSNAGLAEISVETVKICDGSTSENSKNSNQNINQGNVAETSVNDTSKNTVDETESSASGDSEDVFGNAVQVNAVTVSLQGDMTLENGTELSDVMEDDEESNDVAEDVEAEEDTSVDLNQDATVQSSRKDNTDRIEPQLESEQNNVSVKGLVKKSDDKPKKRRKLTSDYRTKLMRKNKKLKRLQAMTGNNNQNASKMLSDLASLASSNSSSSVPTVANLDGCRIVTGTCENTRSKDVKVKPAQCCCQLDRESSDSNSGICQAVEYVDGGLLLCKEKIENSVLLQPSLKIPAITLCKDHRSKALVHGWCPGCGCFCSMGTFMECRRDHTRHHFHSECISEIGNVLYCPHCGEDASRAHKVTSVVPEDLDLITPKQLQHQRQIRLPIALMETVEGSIVPSVVDQQLQSTKKRARMGGKLFYLPKEFEDREQNTEEEDSFSLKLENGKTLNSDLLPLGPTRNTLTAALKCVNTFKSKRLAFSPKNLYLPAVQGDLMRVIALLVEGFDPNHRFPEHNYETAMHGAANKGHHAILYVLLQAGGNCNSKDEDTQTPLMCAASNKQLDCLKQLVFNGADVTCKDDEGTAALHIAAKDGFLEGIKYLTSLPDTDVNIQDDGGWTALVWAAEARHLDVVQHLLDRGCDPNIKDQEGNSGLHWAAYAGAHEIIKLFIESNCDVNAINHNGDTPLHIAAREDRYESVVTLLMREANTLLKNCEKDTPLDCCNVKSNIYLALQVNQKIRQASALRTVRTERILSKDIARGREARPIQVVNAVDNFSFPSDFLYVANSCEISSLNIDRRIIHMKGCQCDDDCSLDRCFCAHSSSKCWYNKNGKLVEEFNYQDPPLIFECGRACNCWMSCKNRVVQHGIRCHLQLFRTNKMGWGLRALQRIPKGTFICEYAGELISDEEADRRQDDSYLFDLDNREGDVYCIDARYYGNISRFINHLCDPNIVPVRIFIDHHDLRFPRIVFFTSRDVNAYEELGFDYGDKFWAIKSKYFNCCCGSVYCKHPLPRPDQEPADTEEDEEIIVD